MRLQRKQLGVALITALLILAIAGSATAFIIQKHELYVRRTSNLINSNQAYQYALGAEAWAGVILKEDYEKNNNIDSLDEPWALIIPPIEVDGGFIMGKISDLQGRLNINNLVVNNKPNAKAVMPFLALIRPYQDLNNGESIYEPIIDWIDRDGEPINAAGAEEMYYMGLEYPYRVGNQPLGSISELRTVRGMTPELYNAISPLLVILPSITPINVNTAHPEILRSIGIEDPSLIEAIIMERMENPFQSAQQFKDHALLKGVNFLEVDLDVKTSFFLLEAVAEIGQGRSEIKSVLYRDPSGNTKVVFRTLGDL